MAAWEQQPQPQQGIQQPGDPNIQKCDILIAMPHSGGSLSFEWAMDFASLFKQAPPNTRRSLFPEPAIDVARDKACYLALQSGAKYLFFLDTDIHPPADVIRRLIAHNLPIVGGLYARRHFPPFNEMLKKQEGQAVGYKPIMEGEYEKGKLVECDAIAFGCVMIKTEILKEMEIPYFRWTEHFAPNGQSEDFWFCQKAKRAGFKIFCDTSIVCKHSGPIKWLPVPPNSPGIFEYPIPGGVFPEP